jgi:hypothetical protein
MLNYGNLSKSTDVHVEKVHQQAVYTFTYNYIECESQSLYYPGNPFKPKAFQCIR